MTGVGTAAEDSVHARYAVRPMLIVNPASDRAFRDFAEATLRPEHDTPALQERLRERYPKAIVRARELSGEPLDVWYVYRDGRWVS